MKPMILDSTMTNMGGVFYPTGNVFALFPDEDCARQAAAALHCASHQGEMAHASPEFILQEIVRTLGGTDIPLPSVGAEGDMVRRIADLAGTGHHGVLICMADKDTPEVRRLVRGATAIAGRVLFAGVPTGVAVTAAQQHGGPWPSSTTPMTTSVGDAALARFLRPVCLQDAPAWLVELQGRPC